MTTQCYAMVRGSAIRVTALSRKGVVSDPIRYAATKSVAKVTVNEVTDAASTQMLREPDSERTRLLFNQPAQTIRYSTDIEFLRIDPGLFSLIAGMVKISADDVGFGFGPFGVGPFGYSEAPADADVRGFDAVLRRPAAAFALEVWSKLEGQRCPDTGLAQYGYTLFPFLKGGYLSGVTFDNGLANFTLLGAQARRSNNWYVGPHDLEGVHERMTSLVSRNNAFRQFITTATPPEQTDGVLEFTDIIVGGGTSTSSDVIDGGTADVTTPWIVEGGGA